MGNDRFQLVGTCLDGKFGVQKFVAEGGFAVVYSGQHLSLDRAIAIKVLKTPAELNEQAREQFIAKFSLEARTIARLSHLNIVQVIDFGVSRMPSGESAPWMVLEWLTGRSLEQDLQQRRGQGGRAPEQALELLEPIFDALAYAHEEGIAHRDVKPANVMIVATKRGEMLKLLDFGIVKIMDKGETADKNLAPTRSMLSAHSPAYAAPEQITGLRTGPWTDVHALALLLTEVMTDLPPYEGKNITTLLREILSPQRPTPARHRIDAGPWEAVLGKALALEPADRFKDAGEFLAALKNAIPAELKPVPLEPEPKEDFVSTQILPPPRSAPKAVPLPAPPRAETPAPLAAGSERAAEAPRGEPPRPVAALRPHAVSASAAAPRSRQPSAERVPRRWLAVAAGIAVVVVGGGYLATRKGTNDKAPEKPQLTRPPEASRRGTPPGTGGGETTTGRSTDTPTPREASRMPSSPSEDTRAPGQALEASRNPVPTVDAKASGPTGPSLISPPPPTKLTTTPPHSTKLGRTGSESARRDDAASSIGRDAGVLGTGGVKASTGDQPAPTRRGRSPENKPLQRTKIQLE